MIRLLIPLGPLGKQRARSAGAKRFHDPVYTQYMTDVWWHAREQLQGRIITGDFALDATYWTPDGKHKSDLDNSVGTILDALQDQKDTFAGKRYVTEPRLYDDDRCNASGSQSFKRSPSGRHQIEIFVMPAAWHIAGLDVLRHQWREAAR